MHMVHLLHPFYEMAEAQYNTPAGEVIPICHFQYCFVSWQFSDLFFILLQHSVLKIIPVGLLFIYLFIFSLVWLKESCFVGLSLPSPCC